MTTEERIDNFIISVRARNRRKTVIGILLIALFGVGFYDATPGTLLFYAYTLIMMALILILAVLAFAASPRITSVTDPLRHFVHWRREFRRQAMLLRFVPLWYILPLLPGIAIFLYATSSIAGMVIVLVIFVGVTILNLKTAAQLERESNLLEIVPEEKPVPLDEDGNENEG